MSCPQCNQVVISNDDLPLLPAAPVAVNPACADEDAIASTPSTGCKLDSCLTDPRDLVVGEGMTLLGRVGSTLTRFNGNGFIEVRAGLAFLVASPKLVVKDLWANWVKPTNHSVPTVGDPLPYPYSTAVDSCGNIHALGGLEKTDKNGIQVHNREKNQWEVIPVDELPHQVSKTLPQADSIELVGFEEVGVLESACGKTREQKALRGNGLPFLERTPVNTCPEDGGDPCQEEAFAYMAQVLEFPTIVADETYKLVYSSSGLAWVQEA
jgi:hypothetical protein